MWTLALSLALAANPSPGKDVGPAEAEQVLVATESFNDAAIGYGGVTPPNVYAFRALLRAADGLERFERVLERGSPAGKLYALCGLFFMDQVAFDKGLTRFRVSGAPVNRMDGCMQTTTTMREALTRDERAPLMSHDGTAGRWTAPYPEHLDIAGGSFCYRLRFFESVWDRPAPAK